MTPPAAPSRTIETPSFSTSRFRAEREADWIAFDWLLGKLEKKGAKALTSDELLQLPLLYRATLSSLSIARATSLDKALLDHLEALSIRGYFLVYGVRESRWSRIRRFFLYDWPAAVRSVWKETIVIALIILLGAMTSYSLVANNPEWYFNFVDEDMSGGRDPRATAEFLQSTIGHGKAAADESESALHIFATYLFTHNSRVSILSFALGFAFGVPTMMLEYYQGIGLGAMVAVFSAKGLGFDFGGWLFIHGTTELFAAALSGAAGLRIGAAVVFPGAQGRLQAAADAGRTAGKVMVGVIVMLFVAGLLEGFGRQLITDTMLRYAIGSSMLLFWLAYYYIPRREDAA
ncbi:stage II sporulation protein M [Sphingopyxis sp. JAI128]|uniref:stage II sporulation protein M n=1 Tax=Sphingopyxis sp. JAI128 TaxID=2723066 RepID=UPI00178F417C|nr:stage II sporulation protein M [Sphingopyxis sp. JAI128]MBB6426230.1 putative membrane protein SpoIIM required for sporulation [Sphingopyxis sp. JAI128]